MMMMKHHKAACLTGTALVIAYFDEKTDTAFYAQSTKDRYTALGLLECAVS